MFFEACEKQPVSSQQNNPRVVKYLQNWVKNFYISKVLPTECFCLDTQLQRTWPWHQFPCHTA